jgi:hypothetical protein
VTSEEWWGGGLLEPVTVLAGHWPATQRPRQLGSGYLGHGHVLVDEVLCVLRAVGGGASGVRWLGRGRKGRQGGEARGPWRALPGQRPAVRCQGDHARRRWRRVLIP